MTYANTQERDELVKRKLSNTLKYAYANSPFYHRLLDLRGLKPSDITTPEQLLEKLPIVDKHDLVGSIPPNVDFEFFSASGITSTEFYTSGSTGKPKIIEMSETDVQVYQRDVRISYETAEIKKGDVILDMYPFGINASGLMSWLGFKGMGVRVIPLGVSPFPPKDMILKTHKPNVLFGLTSYVERMIYELQAKGIDVGKLGIEKILLSGESSTKERKEKLGKYYNAEIFDLYGTSEFGCVGIDCTHKNGVHMLDHSVLTQIVDPETNQPVADGQTGHIIFTRLIDDFETPGTILINYFIGDESKIISRIACECGRLATRIDYPRRADGAVFVSGAKVDYHDLEAILAKPENRDLVTGDFEIVVAANQDGTYNLLCRVEPRQGITLPKNYGEQIVNALKSINFPLANEACGGRIDISVQFVKDSEFELCKKPGKPKRIIDRRK